MLDLKFQHVIIISIIFWLSTQRCFCNESGEVNETKDDAFQETQQNELSSGRNVSRNYHIGIKLASFRWNEIGVFYTVSLFVIITGLSKVAFHHVKWLSSHVPESCILIILGVIVGSIIFVVPTGDVSSTLPTFTPRLFFLILLPPVILESAYSLYNATFYENLYTILLLAVVGTIFNTFSIGFILFGLDNISWMGNWYPENILGQDEIPADIILSQLMIFAALISAVDPVAVLAIFQEVGVNRDLYFLIFGESLLNDAITVVLYNTMVAMASKPTVNSLDYTMAVLSFFTVNLGGVTIGIFFGLITAIITKTTSDVSVLEPLAVLGMSYLSYLTAELFHFSGIISIIFCGLLQAHYTFKNISQESYVTVKYFTKMVSATCEAVIFLFLGIVLLNHNHNFATGFICWSILVCLVCRFIGIFVLIAISNMFRVKRIQLQEQFIMAYGGLRGAVGFSLVIMLEEEEAKAKSVYVTATLAVILFTVFIQGVTIKHFVKLLNIEISGTKEKTLIGEVNNQVASHLMAGIEKIIGFRGNYYFKRKLLDIDEKYLQNIFLKDKSDNRIRHVFEKSALTYHYAHLYGPITLVEDSKAEMLHEKPPGRRLSYIPFVPEEPHSISKQPGAIQSDLFAGVELRRKDPAEVKPGLLRKAFQSSPITQLTQKYFQRYNPNLMDESEQLEAQLELRRRRAKRITLAAYEPYRAPGQSDQLPSLSDISDESLKSVLRQTQSAIAQQYTKEEMVGMENIMRRAAQRRSVSHVGIRTVDVRTLRRAKSTELMTLNEVPGQSSGTEQPHPAKEKELTSTNVATSSTAGTSDEKEIPLQEKPLLTDVDKSDDSENESAM